MIIRVPQCLFYLGKMVGDMLLRRTRDEINVGKKDRPLGNREKIERNTATGDPADTDNENRSCQRYRQPAIANARDDRGAKTGFSETDKSVVEFFSQPARTIASDASKSAPKMTG